MNKKEIPTISKIDKSSQSIMPNKGVVLTVLGIIVIAIILIFTLPEIKPETTYKTGKEYYLAGDYSSAIKTFNEIKPNDSKSDSVNFLLGMVLTFQKGDFEQGLSAFEKCQKVNPEFIKNYDFNYGKGYCHMKLNQHEKALNDFTEAIIIKPSSGESYYGRAKVRIGLDDKRGGCRDFNLALENNYSLAQDAINIYCK